jgi:hypothetical protein
MDNKSSNDITIVSRGRIAASQSRGSSRAAKMRAVARGEDTSKPDPQVNSIGKVFSRAKLKLFDNICLLCRKSYKKC